MNRKQVLTLILSLIFSVVVAQNNAYRIDDSLYPLFLQCNKTMGTAQGLDACNNMFRQAALIHDQKAQCIALVQKVKHFNKLRPYNEQLFLAAIDGCKRFSIKTPYKQYYFNAWVSLILRHINNERYNEAMAELKVFQKEAIRMKNDYGIAESYRQLGNVFYMLHLYDQAITQYRKCLNYFIEHGNERQAYEMYANLADCYYSKNDNVNGLENALLYISKSPSEMTKLRAYVLILSNLKDGEDHAKASTYFNQMQSVRSHTGLGTTERDKYFNACTRYYTVIGNTSKAIAYTDSILDKSDNSLTLGRSFSAAGNFHQAYNYLNDYIRRIDSLNNVKVSQTIAMYSAQFGMDQLEMECHQLELENRQIVMENERRMFISERARDSVALVNQLLAMKNERQLHISDSLRYQKDHESQILLSKAQHQRFRYMLIISLIVITSGILYGIHRYLYTRRLLQDKKEVEEALEVSRKAEKFKDMFLNNMSHEIRTPLNAIVGFTEMLNSEEALLEPGEKEELLTLVRHNSNLLTNLVNDLLDLSRMQSGNYKLMLEAVNPAELCTQACGTVKERVPDGVELRFDKPYSLDNFTFETDFNRSLQVLINYLTNACKYTSSGSIVVTYRVEGEDIEFSVTDTGVGISEDKAADVFNRFAKLDDFKQGTGLGLNICSTIAGLLHGRVWLDTGYKSGARFVFTHPVSQKSR